MPPLLRNGINLIRAELLALDSSFPLFLCPALLFPRYTTPRRSQDHGRRRPFTTTRCSRGVTETIQPPPHNSASSRLDPIPSKALPLTCPGCGAPAQVRSPENAGFYTVTRRGVREWLKPAMTEHTAQKEDEIIQAALKNADRTIIQELGLSQVGERTAPDVPSSTELPVPVCDRCHQLSHHRHGTSIIHPSMRSIEEIIADSPHQKNHIYHVIDAADFPMSLIPNLQNSLKLSPLRTQNRRSKSHKYSHGRIVEVSFIITRADLLAPEKEQVDALFPYLRDVLRDALGRSGHNVRLGNLSCVSSKRGWFTKKVKEEIWERGGAGWMVGKVNVGKSNLFEAVYPKGRIDLADSNLDRLRQNATKAMNNTLQTSSNDDWKDPLAHLEQPTPHQTTQSSPLEPEEPFFHDPMSLLPPPQPATAYPVMPLISDLPGTTAAPIRIPYGSGRGELIDLPGIARSTLEKHVRPEHHPSLIMKSRQAPEKIVLKPGQCLLLGGLIKLVPTNPDLIYIMHPFVTLQPHLTGVEKAEAIMTNRNPNVETIATDEAGQQMRSAGSFKLAWDVTKKQSGTLTARDAGKWKVADLPFIIYSTDVLIEGVGWVEVTCNVRRRYLEEAYEEAKRKDPLMSHEELENSVIPEVEVFSPEGKYIATRRTMNASVLGGRRPPAKHLRKGRPRASMVLMKRFEAGSRSSQAKQVAKG